MNKHGTAKKNKFTIPDEDESASHLVVGIHAFKSDLQNTSNRSYLQLHSEITQASSQKIQLKKDKWSSEGWDKRRSNSDQTVSGRKLEEVEAKNVVLKRLSKLKNHMIVYTKEIGDGFIYSCIA